MGVLFASATSDAYAVLLTVVLVMIIAIILIVVSVIKADNLVKWVLADRDYLAHLEAYCKTPSRERKIIYHCSRYPNHTHSVDWDTVFSLHTIPCERCKRCHSTTELLAAINQMKPVINNYDAIENENQRLAQEKRAIQAREKQARERQLKLEEQAKHTWYYKADSTSLQWKCPNCSKTIQINESDFTSIQGDFVHCDCGDRLELSAVMRANVIELERAAVEKETIARNIREAIDFTERRRSAWQTVYKVKVCEVCNGGRFYYLGYLRTLTCPACQNQTDQLLVACWKGNVISKPEELSEMDVAEIFSTNVTAPAVNTITPKNGVAEELNRMIVLGDYIGIGNLSLEVLTRVDQELSVDEDSLLIAETLPRAVSQTVGLPSTYTLPSLLRDHLIPAEAVGTWSWDTFHQSMIFAYLLGATRANLRSPYDRLVKFYKFIADDQKKLLVEMKTRYDTEQVPRAIDIVFRDSGEDAESKLRALRALLGKSQTEAKQIATRNAPEPNNL